MKSWFEIEKLSDAVFMQFLKIRAILKGFIAGSYGKTWKRSE